MNALVAAALAATVVFAGTHTAAGRQAAGAATLRSFDATDLNGRRWTADDLRGRVVLIDFWATWCAPCLADLPRMKALRNRYSNAELEILGVSLDATSRRSLVSWLNRQRIDWPQMHQQAGFSGELSRMFGVDRLPWTVVIAPDGTIVATNVRGESLATLIRDLIQAARQSDGALEARR